MADGSQDRPPRRSEQAADRASCRDASDQTVADTVLRSLFPGPIVRRERIGVAVASAQVTLSGTFATANERCAAGRIACEVQGVDRVVNLIVVQAEQWTERTFQGPAAACGRDGETGTVAGRIEALFERDPEIDGTGILIQARDGRVGLTGTVQSWRERDLARTRPGRACGVVHARRDRDRG